MNNQIGRRICHHYFIHNLEDASIELKLDKIYKIVNYFFSVACK